MSDQRSLTGNRPDDRETTGDPLDDRRSGAPGEADDGTLLAQSSAIVADETSGTGAATASGGYGASSDRQGWGEGTEDNAVAGQQAPTDWLREAPGGADDADVEGGR